MLSLKKSLYDTNRTPAISLRYKDLLWDQVIFISGIFQTIVSGHGFKADGTRVPGHCEFFVFKTV